MLKNLGLDNLILSSCSGRIICFKNINEEQISNFMLNLSLFSVTLIELVYFILMSRCR